MSDDIKWIGGTIIGLVSLVGGVVMRDRQVAKAIKDGDDTLHERINDVRKEYVRRDDLKNHQERIEASIKEIKDDARECNREINRRLDTVIAAVTQNSSN